MREWIRRGRERGLRELKEGVHEGGREWVKRVGSQGVRA